MQLQKSILLSIILTAVALLTAASIKAVGSQTPAHPPQPEGKPKEVQGKKQNDKERTISIKTDLVVIDLQVIDQKNQLVFDSFKKEDFTVFENNVKQEIANISRDEVPVSLGLIVDTSGSMIKILPTVCDSMIDLVRQMQPGDEAFVAQFRNDPELVQDFTFDRHNLEDAIRKLYASGDNSLFDAIIASSDYAREKAKNRRKALIIFSDGQENNSIVKEKEVIDAITQNEVLVYFVGIIGQNPYAKSSKKESDLLLRLANNSGGLAFFPKNAKEILAVTSQIAIDLRTQFVLSYYPTNDKRDGTFRAVRVAINKGKRKLSVRTRQGYYARKEEDN